MGAPAAAGGLLVGQVDHAFRSALVGLAHGQYVGGVDGREVANLAGEGRPGAERCVERPTADRKRLLGRRLSE